MKKLVLAVIAIFFSCIFLIAQTPTSFQYQAVLHDASGQVLANQEVEIGIAILQGSASGAEVFSENYSVTTNNFGLANLQIGSVNQAGMEAMDWSAGPYFVQVSVDGTIMGTSQLLSVPFAMHAITVENDAVEDDDSDPENEIQDISLSGNELSISGGSTVVLPDEVNDADADPTNELQVLSIKGDTIFLSDGGYVILPEGFDGDFNSLTNIPPNLDADASDDFDGQYISLSGAPENVSDFNNDAAYITSPDDADSDPTNEIQVLSIKGDTVFLSEGGYIKLPAGFNGDFNSLSNIPENLDIDSTDDFDGQYSSLSGIPENVSEFTNDAGFLTNADDADADPSNELQVLSIKNDTVFLSDGGYAKLPAGFDGDFTSLSNIPENLDIDSTDDFDGQYSSLAGVPQNVSEFTNDAGYITNADDADADPTNELQDISLNGTDLSISNGSTVDLSVIQDGIGTDDQLLSWLINKNGELKIGIQNGNSLDMNFVKDGTGWDEWAGNKNYVAKWGSGGFLEKGSIFDNGNIGIGTETPGAKLEVAGQVKITGGSPGTGKVLVSDNEGLATWEDNLDNDPTNELNTGVVLNGTDLEVTDAGGTITTDLSSLVDDADSDPTNELQAISISNDTIYLSNGGGVKLPTEADPIFSAWDKSSGVAISESQITDLDHFTNADETDPVWEADSSIVRGEIRIEISDSLSTLNSQLSIAIKDSIAQVRNEIPSVTTYSVGDFAQGGIVFWVDETGQHGLVCAKTDQDGGSGIRWYAGTYGYTQAKGDGSYAGEANTSIIIAAQVAIGDDGSTYAARICNELQVTEGGKTYGDWYLPSKEESNLMYQNKVTIDATAGANGGSNFANTYYWSSTGSSNGHAWYQSFISGSQYDGIKDATYGVRAVRAF